LPELFFAFAFACNAPGVFFEAGLSCPFSVAHAEVSPSVCHEAAKREGRY
jgi:hypothetical protein